MREPLATNRRKLSERRLVPRHMGRNDGGDDAAILGPDVVLVPGANHEGVKWGNSRDNKYAYASRNRGTVRSRGYCPGVARLHA